MNWSKNVKLLPVNHNIAVRIGKHVEATMINHPGWISGLYLLFLMFFSEPILAQRHGEQIES